MSGYIKTHVSREEDNVDRGATIADILAARSSLGIRAANDPSGLTITEKVIIIWDRRLYDYAKQPARPSQYLCLRPNLTSSYRGLTPV